MNPKDYCKALEQENATLKKRVEGEMDRIELAILANGGDKMRQDWCTCEPEVGMSPCEYCAVRNGLQYAKKLQQENVTLKACLMFERDKNATLKKRVEDLKFKLSCHTRDCIGDYEDMEKRAEQAEADLAFLKEAVEKVKVSPTIDNFRDLYAVLDTIKEKYNKTSHPHEQNER